VQELGGVMPLMPLLPRPDVEDSWVSDPMQSMGSVATVASYWELLRSMDENILKSLLALNLGRRARG
jgi:hypothetical protein